MNIIYKNFKIIPCENAPGRFDLLRIVKRRKLGGGTKKDPQGEEYDATVDISLGTTLVGCIQDILHIQTVSELGEKDVSLPEFLQEWQREKSLLQAEFDKLFNIKIN